MGAPYLIQGRREGIVRQRGQRPRDGVVIGISNNYHRLYQKKKKRKKSYQTVVVKGKEGGGERRREMEINQGYFLSLQKKKGMV